MNPFNDVSFKQFKDSFITYMKGTLNETETDSAVNGFKALALLYFGHSDNWTDDEINEGVVLIRTAARRWLDVEKENE